MKLARFDHGGTARIGLVLGNEIIDLVVAAPRIPQRMTQLIGCLDRYRDTIEAAVAAMRERIPVAQARLLAPIEEPRRFIAVGLNYAEHSTEMCESAPTRPRLFVKLAGSLSGPYEPVSAPAFSTTLDYEGELAFVIGRRCRDVSSERAGEVICGYLVLNDFSIREYVNQDLLILGKGCRGFAPCGPWLTTSDEVGEPHGLPIRTWVNGELRQNASTADMIFNCYELVEWITRAVTLEPGDLITTGSPSGSAVGFKPPRYLQPGDCVRVQIGGLGDLRTLIGRPQ